MRTFTLLFFIAISNFCLFAQEFSWAKKFGNAGNDAKCVVVDGSGNTYTTGRFTGTLDFDPGAGAFNLTSNGNDDIFIVKLNSSGNFVWAKKIGGAYSDTGNSITTDPFGNIYTTGFFTGTVDFNPGAGVFNLTSNGDKDAFVFKLDPSGNFVWAKNIGGTIDDCGNSIHVDLFGNVYTTGYFKGVSDFDPSFTTFNLIASGNADVFISKLNSSGDFLWAKQVGGLSDDYGYSIDSDSSGNVYTSGGFLGTSDFNPNAGLFNLTSNGEEDVFITKLDSTGNFLWAKQIGGVLLDRAAAMTVDQTGNVYITGSFNGTTDFDPGIGSFNLVTNGYEDVFLTKLDTNGNFLWAKSLGGAESDIVSSIALNSSGNLFLAGYFSSTVDFNPGVGITNLTSTGNEDIFISKLDTNGSFIWAKKIGGSYSDKSCTLALDGSGNPNMAGYFSLNADFDPNVGVSLLSAAGGGKDIFFNKLDLNGNFIWAKNIGSNSANEAWSVVTDASGNVYSCGFFELTVDFNPGLEVFNMTTQGQRDIFVSKLDSNGNFLWAKAMGSAGNYERGISLKLDASGNIYTTGIFAGICDFDPGPGTYNLFGSGGGVLTVFISKLDNNGNFIWAKEISGGSSSESQSIAIDSFNNVYVTGNFAGAAAVDFDPGPGTFLLTTGTGWKDVFVTKLDSNGIFVWAKQMGGWVDDEAFSVDVDYLGNVYTTGYFSSVADFDPGPATFSLTSLGSGDIFISKLDNNGNFIWVKQIGGPVSDWGKSIVTDDSGNVYTAGFHTETSDFDPGPGVYNLTSIPGGSNVFVSKLDSNGNFIWAKTIGTSSPTYGNTLALDAMGSVYVGGMFLYTVDFDPGPGVYNLASSGSFDMFVSKFEDNGNFVWAEKFGGADTDYQYGLTVDNDHNVITCGDFRKIADFDSGPLTFNLICDGVIDAFIQKTGQCIIPSTPLNITSLTDLTICENTSTMLAINGYGILSYYDSAIGGNFLGNGSTYFTGILTDTTTYYVQDSICGPSSRLAITVNVNPQFSSSVSSQTNLECYGDADGLATVTAIGNIGTLTYLWSPIGGISATGFGLSAGTYTCVITDDSACSNIETLVITEPAPINSTISTQNNLSCNGDEDGSITILSGGGTGPLTYTWNPSGGNSSTASGLSGGSYFCVVSDDNFCTDTLFASISEPSVITANVSSQNDVSCNSGNDGSVAVSASGGTGVLSYTWNPNGGTSSSASGLSAGSYFCVITDANSCDDTQYVTLSEPPPIDISTNLTLATITSNQIGATYQWLDCNNGYLPISGQSNQSFTATQDGNYAVMITLGACVDTSVCDNIIFFKLEENNNNDIVKLYPNPTSDFINIESTFLISKIEIIDISGRTIYSQNIESNKGLIGLSDLSAGTYVIRIFDNDKLFVSELPLIITK